MGFFCLTDALDNAKIPEDMCDYNRSDLLTFTYSACILELIEVKNEKYY